MVDVAPELWEEIKRIFWEKIEGDAEIKKILEKIDDGVASYEEAHEYALRIGKHASRALKKVLNAEVLPEGIMYFNIAERTVRPALEFDRELVENATIQIQEDLNAAAGIGMKAVVPQRNEDRIEGIINRMCSETDFDKIRWIMGAPVETYSQSIVDDFVKENAGYQYAAGLEPKIRRIAKGKGCQWCRDLEGVYDYADVNTTGEDVFRRHDNCNCIVTYDPGDGRRQDVHSKRWYDK